MIKLGIIVTNATGETGSIVAAEPLESGHPVRSAPGCAEKMTVDRN